MGLDFPSPGGKSSGKNRRIWLYVLLAFIAFILIVAFAPTPHARVKNEFKSDLTRLLDCSQTIEDNWLVHWDVKDLPDNLRVEVDVAGTEELKIYIQSVAGTVSDERKKVHDYTVNCNGPSLYIEIKNPGPWIGSGPSSVVSGDIHIYNDYETQVTYIEWLPWWMP